MAASEGLPNLASDIWGLQLLRKIAVGILVVVVLLFGRSRSTSAAACALVGKVRDGRCLCRQSLAFLAPPQKIN